MRVTISRSLSEPVVTTSKTSCSAAMPPSAPMMRPRRYVRVVAVAIRVGRRQRDPEGAPARNDRDLAHRVGARLEHPEQRVPRLVVGRSPPLRLGDDHVARGAELDLLQRVGNSSRW